MHGVHSQADTAAAAAAAAAEARAKQQQEVKAEPESPDCMDEPEWASEDESGSDAKVCTCILLHSLYVPALYTTTMLLLQEAASDSDADIPLRQLQAKLKAKRARDEGQAAMAEEPVVDLSVSDDEAPRKRQRAHSVEAQAINAPMPLPAVKMSREQRKFLRDVVLASDVGWSWAMSDLDDDEKLRDLFEAVACHDPDAAWAEESSW